MKRKSHIIFIFFLIGIFIIQLVFARSYVGCGIESEDRINCNRFSYKKNHTAEVILFNDLNYNIPADKLKIIIEECGPTKITKGVEDGIWHNQELIIIEANDCNKEALYRANYGHSYFYSKMEIKYTAQDGTTHIVNGYVGDNPLTVKWIPIFIYIFIILLILLALYFLYKKIK